MEVSKITRTDLLNHLIKKHGLKRYLEIGVQNTEQNFDKIECEYKVGVDPDPNSFPTFPITSDSFFGLINSCVGEFIGTPKIGIDSVPTRNYDLVFIDGLHTAEQVQKDFENSLRVLSKNGFIVLHDCNPLKEEHTIVPRPIGQRHWNGSCYKFAIGLEKQFACTVDIDNGCLVFSNRDSQYEVVHKSVEVTFNFFDINRKRLLNLISWDEFISIGSYV